MKLNRCLHCMREYPPGEEVCPVCGSCHGKETNAEYALSPGQILNGRYLVGTTIGQGGFGISYVGWDLFLNAKVAIKEYFPLSTGNVARNSAHPTVFWSNTHTHFDRDAGIESFLKEARKMARVRKIPSVVDVLDLFAFNNTAYIVMTFIEGEDFQHILARKGPMSFEECLRTLTPIMQALEQVHRENLIHRDISPDNLMMDKNGSVWLLDLGAAKELDMPNGNAQSSLLVAKHGFSPPEQYTQSAPIGTWTDVYAMSATIYYCVTGKLPPMASDRFLEDTLVCRPPLTATQFRVLQEGMVLRPKERIQTIGELLRRLQDAAAVPKPQPPIPAKNPRPAKTPTPAKPPKKPPLFSRKGLISLICAVAVAVIMISVGLGWALQDILQTPQTPSTSISSIAAGQGHTVALCADGTVLSTGNNYNGQCDVSDWRNMLSLAAGDHHTVGLTSDRQVIAVGNNRNGQCNTKRWRNIAEVCAGGSHTVGLTLTGTVLATGSNVYGQCDVSLWRNIVSVAAGKNHTVGLHSDGTVTAVGLNKNGETNVSHWTGIAAVAAGDGFTVGLTVKGTVVLAGSHPAEAELAGWKKIQAIVCASNQIFGLRSDGTVLAAGSNYFGQCNTDTWEHIIAIAAGNYHTVALTTDGTLLTLGADTYGQRNTSDWKNLLIP